MNVGWYLSYATLWIVVAFQAMVSLALLKQLSDLRQLVQQQEVGEDIIELGTSAPEFTGVAIYSGQTVTRRTIDSQGAVILFLSPNCSVCKDLVASMEPSALGGLPPVVAFCRGSERACASFARRFGVNAGLLVASAEEVAFRYHAFRVPTAVAVGDDRMIRGYAHPKHVEDLHKLKLRVYTSGSVKTESKSEPILSSPRSVV